MRRIRLLASDLDGTLLRPDETVSDRTREALAAALIVTLEVAGVALLLDRFGSIGGWRPAEVVLLFGLGFTAQGLASVMLSVVALNDAGIRAYTKAGFREIGRRR